MLNPEDHPNYLEQVQLEIDMAKLAQGRYLSRFRSSSEGGRGGSTPEASQFIRRNLDAVVEGLEEYLADAASGRPGPASRASVLLREMDPEAVGYVATRTVIGVLMGRPYVPLTRLALEVANRLEAEARFQQFEKEAPALYSKMKASTSASGGTEDHKITVLTYAMGKYDIPWDRWSHPDKLHLGAKLVDIVRSSSGLLDIQRGEDTGISRSLYDHRVVILTDEAAHWLQSCAASRSQNEAINYPMVMPPRPWVGFNDGGYIGQALKPYPLVKPRMRGHSSLLKDAYMGVPRAAVNAIQETPWEINSQVLEVMKHFGSVGNEVGGIPPAGDLELPPKPFDIATNEDSRREWKYRARDTHASNLSRRAERLEFDRLLELADKFEGREIFFPHNLDFRGRVYSIPNLISPQGSDKVKSLIRFRESHECGATGARWLAVQGSNCFGNDKVSFAERIAWVKENSDSIVASASDPVSNLWWTEADDPWQFLAFCFEWAGYCADPFGFRTQLPIAMDGSCNGLQHFSAMLLDEVGGAAVNLLPSDKPEDIYQRVADTATEALKRKAALSDGTPECLWAQHWSAFGLDRKITKRPVMVLPYGGTPRSCMEYVRQAVEERMAKGEDPNLGEDFFKAVAYLSKVIWNSIGKVVIAARAAMAWLQKAARVLSAKGVPVDWTTPSGFVVRQAYPNMKKARIKTHVNGSLLHLAYYREAPGLDKPKQANSISPNFVHSLDAAALVLTVVKLKAEGMNSFAMIHDSYGTHASHADLLYRTLREVFVEMYQTNPLEKFREELIAQYPEIEEELPPLPPKGSLDLEDIKDSDYFFA